MKQEVNTLTIGLLLLATMLRLAWNVWPLLVRLMEL
jgi:hypothetical protein